MKEVLVFPGDIPIIFENTSFKALNQLLTANDKGIISFIIHEGSNNELL